MQPYWAGLTVRDHREVLSLRDELWERFGEPAGYDRVDPHITIHPGFSVPDKGAANIAGTLVEAVGDSARLGPLQFWPSPEEPMVVKLSVEADLSSYRTDIIREVALERGTIDRQPVPMHMTLFKSGDTGEDPEAVIDRPVKELGAAVADAGVMDTEISGFRMESRS